MDQKVSITKQIVDVIHQTFYSKISWNIKKISFKTFSNPFHIKCDSNNFISNFDSNTFISKFKIKYISNIFFSDHQISNGAQPCGTFQMGG